MSHDENEQQHIKQTRQSIHLQSQPHKKGSPLVGGFVGAILGLVLWVFLRPIFRGVGWVISLISALMIIYWLLTL